jgi:leucyl aminopeptidase
MKIFLVNKFLKEATPVFIVRGKARIRNHPFFDQLSKEDQELILFFEKNRGEEEVFERTLFLRGGKALVLGVPENFTHRKAILALRRVVLAARRERISRIQLNFEDFFTKNGPGEENLAEVLAIQLEIANFEFVEYKTTPKNGYFFVEEAAIFKKKSRMDKIKDAIERGKIIGEEVNNARLLSNMPGGDITPQGLAEAAIKAGKRAGFEVKIFNEKEIKSLNMGGILGVARGSSKKPRFIIMEYRGGAKSDRPTVLVGKGVTFDTGGLNLKPEQGIYEMHMDKSGGASVIHTIAALARLKVKKNVVGLVPAVENMPSGSSYHPGDILRTMDGKTIEVLNTDAEGRIILADALAYAKRYNPKLVVDLATLTGAAIVALGQRASVIFSNNEKNCRAMQEIGEIVGDYVWPLPLWEEYEEEIKGTFGDVANMGKTRYGGAIVGAVFLWQFIKNSSTGSGQVFPWIHIDIAPRMTAIDGEFLAKGSAGAGVALLTKFLLSNS